jgi:hypothetical protein
VDLGWFGVIGAASVTCSTCDGYEFVDGPIVGGLKVSCPDCPPKVRCVVHGLILTIGNTCPACTREARKAMPLVVLSSLTSDLRDRVASAAQPLERSVA